MSRLGVVRFPIVVLLSIVTLCITLLLISIVTNMDVTSYIHIHVSPTNSSDDTTTAIKPSLYNIQSLINSYVLQLSQSDYRNVSNEIIANNLIFPHLSMKSIISAFKNHKIWMSGDSTVENVFIFISFILQEYDYNAETNQTSFYIDLYKGVYNFNKHSSLINMYNKGHMQIQIINHNTRYFKSKEFHLTNIKQSGSEHYNTQNHFVLQEYKQYNLTLYGSKVQECGYYPAKHILQNISMNVVISNMDLVFCCHLTNIFTTQKFNVFKNRIRILKDHNIDLENRMNRFVNNAINSSVKCLILYGANSIDESKYYGVWNTSVNLWNRHHVNKEILDDCLMKADLKPGEIVVNTSNTTGIIMNATEWCIYSTLTSFGIEYLNKRMLSWIQWKQNELDQQGNDINTFKLLYWNQQLVTHNRTEYSGDGRHYYPLVPVKAEIITNIIAKWC